MALIPYAEVKDHPFTSSLKVYKWAGMTTGDLGQPLYLPQFSDKTVQALGDMTGGGTLDWKGTLMPPGESPADADFGAVHDNQGNAIALAAKGALEVVAENVFGLRPVVTGTLSVGADAYAFVGTR